MKKIVFGFMALAAGLSLFAFAHASTGVHLWLKKGDKFSGELMVDDKRVCSFDLVAAVDGMQRKPTCEFEMPKFAKHASLKATLVRAETKKTINLNDRWQLHDAAQLTSPIYDEKLSVAQRMLKFTDHLKAIEAKHRTLLAPGSLTGHFQALPGRDFTSEFNAVEKKMGVSLPKALRDVLSLSTTIGDSKFHAPTEITSVERLLGEWDYGDLSKLLSADTLARYRRSIAVFTEVGSGLGALAYDPQGVKAGEPSNAWGDSNGAGAVPNGQGVWFWVHQKSSIKTPTLLLDREGRPSSLDVALLVPMQRIVIDSLLGTLVENNVVKADDRRSIWIDSSHPKAMLQLHVDDDKRSARLWLRSYDHYYSLL